VIGLALYENDVTGFDEYVLVRLSYNINLAYYVAVTHNLEIPASRMVPAAPGPVDCFAQRYRRR
jgi:hypothetical protein